MRKKNAQKNFFRDFKNPLKNPENLNLVLILNLNSTNSIFDEKLAGRSTKYKYFSRALFKRRRYNLNNKLFLSGLFRVLMKFIRIKMIFLSNLFF